MVAATQLLRQQGIGQTTLADIAEAADVPVGNVYYYFKTKDDIIAAVIETHAQHLAFDLLAAYEGSALLANTMRDPSVLAGAARRLDRWIDTL